MSKFIKFSQAEKEQARTTDLAEFLTAQGEEVKKMGSEYVWLDGGQKVTIRGNLWFHQYEQKGGDSIDFVRRYYHKGYGDAVQMLLGGNAGTEISHDSYTPNRPKPQQPKQPFVLPVKNDNMRRMFAYLLFTRGLDKGVVQEFVRRFREINGTILCRELLEGVKTQPGNDPEARTPEYYARRPCLRHVGDTRNGLRPVR